MKQLPSNIPQTRVAMIEHEVANLNSGNKTIEQVGRELGLQPQQVTFCIEYVNHTMHTGRGLQAAANAYGYDVTTTKGKTNAYACSNNNLKDIQCGMLIDILLSGMGMNDHAMDKRLFEIAMDRSDNKTAVLAIQEYNKVKNRIQQTIQVYHKPVMDFTAYTPDQLKMLLQLIQVGKIQDNTREIIVTEVHDNMTVPTPIPSSNAPKTTN